MGISKFATHNFCLCIQPIDKQSLLDSGILCCLIHVLNALLGPDGGNQRQTLLNHQEQSLTKEIQNDGTGSARRLEVASSCAFAFSLLSFTWIFCISIEPSCFMQAQFFLHAAFKE